MNKKLLLLLSIVGIIAGWYLVLPATKTPNQPANSLTSQEPADTESKYRTAYFTNLSREEIMSYYKSQFTNAINLNHPPEDSFTVIRDQTPSSWLEELHRPWKDTLYINGYYPVKATDQIYRDGKHYAAKITIRYIPSSISARFTILLLTLAVAYAIIREYAKK